MKNILFALLLGAATEVKADVDDDRPKIMNRLFPKAKSVEVSASAGYLLNPAFVDTSLFELNGRYSFSETWGLGVGFALAKSKDRNERRCVETFYNDPKHEVEAECMNDDGGEGLDGAEEANVGPAYAPIRELRQLVTLHGDYSLAYGKMIFLHGVTSHFDLRIRFGGGMTTSDYYEQQPERRDPGVGKGETDRYGGAGRPESQRQATPHAYVGFAEDLLFLKRFSFGAELAYYVLIGTPHGVEQFVVMKVGAGVRF